MKLRVKHLIAVVGVALSLALVSGVVWQFYLGHRTIDENENSRVTDNESVVPEDGVQLQWRLGASQHYKLQTDSSMTLNADQAMTTPSLTVKIESDLAFQTLEVGEHFAVAGLQLSSVDMNINGESKQQVNEALSVPFRVRFSTSGLPESFDFSELVTSENRLILENLVRMFQVDWQLGETWVTRESTALGSYSATYHRKQPLQISKTKHNFSGLPDQPMFIGAMITSNETIAIDREFDWVSKINSSETVITSGQNGPAMKILNEASLTLLADVKTAPNENRWSFDASAPPSNNAVESNLASLTPAEARRRLLAEVDSLNNAAEGRIVFIHRIRDLLKANELQPDVLLETMQTDDLSDRTRADVYLALELADTIDSQTALTSVMMDPAWSNRDALRAIVALGGVDEPSDTSLDTLWMLTQNNQTDNDARLASTATFALGTLGKTMRLAEHPAYADHTSRLLDGAMGAATDLERANYVHAIGNTQDEALAESMSVLLQDQSSMVRRATAQSLGAIGPDQVANKLLSQLVKEANGSVRGAIAEAMQNWTTPTPDAVLTVRNLLPTEVDENARLHMAMFLGENLSTFPESEQLLRQLLRVEQSKNVRQKVAETLAKNSLHTQ